MKLYDVILQKKKLRSEKLSELRETVNSVNGSQKANLGPGKGD